LQAVVSTTKQEDADPSAGLSDFFGFRHERVIVEAVEESYRDCLRCLVHATKKRKGGSPVLGKGLRFIDLDGEFMRIYDNLILYVM